MQYAKKLVEKGEAYYCFCDKNRLESLQTEVNGEILMHYDKHCLSLSKEEVEELAKFIDQSRNDLFGYSGLDLLLSRYLIRDHQHVVLESPQEMYLGISMHLAMKEKENRLQYVKEFYDMMSLHQVTWQPLPSPMPESPTTS